MYGCVVLAYDDDGNEYVVKTFWDEDARARATKDDWEDDEWEDSTPGGIDCGILREIVMLRLFDGGQPNLVRLEDSTTTERRAT